MIFGQRKRGRERAAVVDRAHRLVIAGDREGANELLRPAAARFPDDPEIRLLYATTLLEFEPEGVGAEAIAVLELAPEDPIILTRLSNLLLFAEKIDEARSSLGRARELAPPDFLFESELSHYEGMLAAWDGEDDVAEAKFRSAVAGEPKSGPFALHLARFLANRGRDGDAIAAIDEALPRVSETDDLEGLRDELSEGTFRPPTD
jgi:Flp pilus assembly protein TadD